MTGQERQILFVRAGSGDPGRNRSGSTNAQDTWFIHSADFQFFLERGIFPDSAGDAAGSEPGQVSEQVGVGQVQIATEQSAEAVQRRPLRACLLKIVCRTGEDQLMVRTGVISDEFWAAVEPVLPKAAGRRGRPWADHRTVLEGIAWRYRVGAPWRDLTAEFGPWQTVWKRHYRWSLDGTYDRMFAAVKAVSPAAGAGLDEQVRLLLSVDSTVVRAH